MPLSFDGTTYVKTPDTREEGGYKPLPEGEHVLTVEECEIDENDKGTFCKFTWLVGNGKRKIWDTMYLDGHPNDKVNQIGGEKFAKVFSLMGVEPKFKDRQEAMKLCMRVIGKQVMGKTKNREYEGKTYSNVTSYKALSSQKDQSNDPSF